MADLQELFARLKNQQSDHSQNSAQQQAQQPNIWQPNQQYQQPAVSSPLFSPPIQTPNPVHSSNIISPVNPASSAGTPAPDVNRTNNLLNLLKFNGQPGQQQGGQTGAMANLQNVNANRHSSSQTRDAGSSRPLSAADLMSSLRGPSSTRASPSPMAGGGAEKSEGQAASPNAQDFLLNLLTKPKSQQPPIQAVGEPVAPSIERAEKKEPDVDILAQNLAATKIDTGSQARAHRESTPVRQFGSPAAQTSPFEALQPSKAQMFTYVNPFDQLNMSSPLNRTPKPEQQAEVAHAAQPKKIEILKHTRDASSQNGDGSAHATKSRKMGSNDTASAHAADEKNQQSVSEALEDVGEQVDKQVEEALAKAGDKSVPNKSDPTQGGDAANDEPTVKKEETDDVESNWDSAEDTNKEEFEVEVYNFPMKPFVSLQIQKTKQAQPIRQDNFMVIASLKKEFDQVDRCLVTATQAHIVYAQAAAKKDNGGFRIIRQDTGDHKQVFRSSGERVFSVQLCTNGQPSSDVETVLGTGVNGSLFWSLLGKSRGDLFADDDVEAKGFAMPPLNTAEENNSGSPVKTRAKMSCRHPDFFAVARGKQIFIVGPETVRNSMYCDGTTRIVDSEKFFNEHSLKINTGKAGKDFCFSEDDTVIVSLDKNGRFKFWDIRELSRRASILHADKQESVELKEPLWTMMSAASGSKPDEKPSVSSILFLDKDRPFTKGTALRYMLIGFKQNHTLQLWDLGLGKAVQELRLPHEKDSDGICSISYHPKTGIIAVGHPTRNSIYFIHLSAPKYNLPAMEQAKFINMLAQNDPGLPKPESTAIMSGLREFSFAKVGQLRSVDMLRTPVETASEKNSPEETLFELYAMHSKGVVGISVKRDDLGWDDQSKMVNPKDAVKEGVVEVGDLIQPSKQPTPSEQSSNAENSVSRQTSKSATSKKPEPTKAQAPPKVEIKKKETSPTSAANGTARIATPEPSTKPVSQAPTNPPLMTPDSYALAAQPAKSSTAEEPAEDATKRAVASSKQDGAASNLSTERQDVEALLTKHFDSLYSRIESDKRVQEAAAGAKQDGLLRVVSSTLTENVDRSLANIISSRIEKDVIPTLTDVTSKVAERKIAETLPQQLNASVSSAIKSTLSNTLQQALKDKDVQRTISETTASAVSAKVQQQVSTLLQQSLPNMATQAAQKMVGDLEKRLGQQMQQAETQRQKDNAKIEELSNMVRSLSHTVQNMAASQSAFQEQILKMQRESKSNAGSARSNTSGSAAQDPPAQPEQDNEVTEMAQKLMQGQYEEATIQWISSDRQAEIFDRLFVRVDPDYLRQVSPLVALTVSAALTSSFDTNLKERLDWLGRVLAQIDMRDSDIRDVAPKIMDVLSQRLQGAYMEISEANPSDTSLKSISQLNRLVNEIRRMAS
ncbi:hypothetical protein DOTSEDRAFT_123822 [Lecanosticta acicola]|uniref:EDC4-like protein pdc1 beta-propeller domain-containing protein n=1 Tax=Lecanosticta acicola TaxID=111012 RepID=A0AAI8YXA7_9PEZI|nr:hypothetical protein DOTSEDRAFT_123822 [Lecanosticta acicola]